MADRYPPPHDHDSVEVHHVHHDTAPDPVVVERDSRAGFGMVLGLIMALILALVLLWFAFGSNLFGTGGATNVQPNSGPTININPPQQAQPQPGGSGMQGPSSPAGPGAGSGSGSGGATP